MPVVFFKKPYKVRRYGKTEWKNGVSSSPYTDETLYLDVQGVTRANQDEQSGKMTTGSLTVYSNEEMRPAEADQKHSGDRIFTMGRWYVCKQSVYWGNTILRHWVSQFEAVEGEESEGTADDN